MRPRARRAGPLWLWLLGLVLLVVLVWLVVDRVLDDTDESAAEQAMSVQAGIVRHDVERLGTAEGGRR